MIGRNGIILAEMGLMKNFFLYLAEVTNFGPFRPGPKWLAEIVWPKWPVLVSNMHPGILNV